MMKERPILFSGPMVRAILVGRKTQTRRVVKFDISGRVRRARKSWHIDDPLAIMGCPYGHHGDRLWVRETWKYWDWTEDGMPWIKYAADNRTKFFDSRIPAEWGDKLADAWEKLSRLDNFRIGNAARDYRWRPSIHMPRWASRINLEVTGVRVERLQDITREDAKAEGFWPSELNGLESWNGRPYGNANLAFEACWRDINGKTYPWDSNPLVWVVSFKVV